MKPSEVLRKARAWLSDPTRWTKGAYFRDADGDEVDVDFIYPTAPPGDAACACALGAVRIAGGYTKDKTPPVDYLTEALPDMRYSFDVYEFNDQPETTHADILEVFDRAIALAEAAQD